MSESEKDLDFGSLLNTHKEVNKGKEINFFKCTVYRRYVVVLMGLVSISVLLTQRVNLSIAIVAMTQTFSVTSPNGTTSSMQHFSWSPEEKGKILSSFFYGYPTTQFLGGWIATKYGGVATMGAALILSSLITILTPILVTDNIYTLIVLRVLLGALQGTAFPSMVSVLSHWSPKNEHTWLISIASSGFPIGASVGYAICGFMSDSFGWQSTFYFTGLIGIFWSIIWLSFLREKPKDDPWITKREFSELVYDNDLIENNNKVSVYPFKEMLTSLPVLACVVLCFSSTFGTVALQTELPTFFNDVFHFDSTKIGLITSLPDLFLVMTYLTVGYGVSIITKRKTLTMTQIRKLFSCSALLFQGILSMSLVLTSSSTTMIFLFLMIRFVEGFSYTSIDTNPLDLAPQYAGMLFGFINMFGTLAGILAPTFCGYVVTNKSLDEWHTVFMTIGGVYGFGSIVYGMFGSGDKQPWASAAQEEVKSDESAA